MKILWLVNVALPMATNKLGLPSVTSAGWLTGQIIPLSQNGIEVIVCSPCDSVDKITSVKLNNNTTHYLMPTATMTTAEFVKILDIEKPSLVHIFGTEFEHSNQMINACADIPSVVSIQGLKSECAKSYFLGLPKRFHKPSIFIRIMARIYLAKMISYDKYEFEQDAIFEIDTIKKAKHIIGRTHWDKRCVLAINPAVKYYKVNENLRDEFYNTKKWSYQNCDTHSIFTSQATYPIKGVHFLLKAMASVVKKYPDCVLYIGGQPPLSGKNKFEQLLFNLCYEYQGYLKKLIKKYKLQNNVVYTGNLTAEQMKQHYLDCNVFVSSSTIENSSNSIGEAMMLGVPIIASNAGGTTSILQDKKDGFIYEIQDTKTLQNYICKVFDMQQDIDTYCENAILHAKKTHNKTQNTNDLMNVYKEIIGGA